MKIFWKLFRGLWIPLLFITQLKSLSLSQPYYAAMKGVSCATCHVNPAGGGARKNNKQSPGFINEYLSVGADLRGAFSNDGNPLTDFSFKAQEQRLYVVADLVPGITLAYANDSGSTAEMYGILQSKERNDIYLRFGKFFLPYGLQISDPDNSSYIKTAPFAPTGVGFSLQPGLTDFGIEVGLAPRKNYFLNLSLTNGSNPSGSGSAKAFTGRAGFVTQTMGLGVTGFQKAVPSTPKLQTIRYGFFGWMKLGHFVFLGEAGQGYDQDSSTQTRKNVSGAYAEINYKFGEIGSYPNYFLLKGKFDYSQKESHSSEKFRYTLGVEWFLKKNLSFDSEYRIHIESPEIDNDQALLLAHLWF